MDERQRGRAEGIPMLTALLWLLAALPFIAVVVHACA